MGIIVKCPECGTEFNELLYSQCPECGSIKYKDIKEKDEPYKVETENEASEETTPRCGAFANDKQNVLLNIFCLLLIFLAWLPYLILKKKHPKKAEGCALWGLIGSAVSLLGIMLTSGKINPVCIILCIIYYVLWRRA